MKAPGGEETPGYHPQPEEEQKGSSYWEGGRAAGKEQLWPSIRNAVALRPWPRPNGRELGVGQHRVSLSSSSLILLYCHPLA